MQLTNWTLAGAFSFILLMFHLRFVPIIGHESVRGFWRERSQRSNISKGLFISSMIATILIGVVPVIGIVISGALFFAHGLTALRK